MNKLSEQYKQQTFDLARSIVLKSSLVALIMNEFITAVHGRHAVDKMLPQTWRYYKHLAGEYYQMFDINGNLVPYDQDMYVTSLDDGSTILFDKQNLINHPVTKEGYKMNSKYYNRLVDKYPDQESLINGILDPVDINAAIDAEDWSILTYDSDLIEPQEDSLIYELERWIKDFQNRWLVDAFTITDSLYMASEIAILYSFIPSKIQSIRLAKSLTSEAHSFHMRMYLDGYYGLGKYIDDIPLEHVSWLYKNIRYISKHIGKQSTVNMLIRKLFTENGIGLSKVNYTLDRIRKDDSVLMDYSFTRIPLTTTKNDPLPVSYDLDTLLAKETQDKPTGGEQGDIFRDYKKDEYDKLLSLSSNGNLDTKVVETVTIDYGDINPITKSLVTLDNWMYYAIHNRFTNDIVFSDPNTGNKYYLSQKDSVKMFMYLVMRYLGIDDIVIPEWVVTTIPEDNVSPAMLLKDLDYDDHVTWLIGYFSSNRVTPPMVFGNVDTFTQYVDLLYGSLVHQWTALANTHDLIQYSNLKKALSRMLSHKRFPLETSNGSGFTCNSNNSCITFSQWLNGLNIDLNITDSYDVLGSIKSLLKVSCNLDLDNDYTFNRLVKAVTSIFKTLTAYTTQNVTEISDTPLFILNNTSLRITDNPIGFISKPDLSLICRLDYKPDMESIHCDTNFVPQLTMNCGPEYIPNLSIDCSGHKNPVLTMICGAGIAPPIVTNVTPNN